MKKKKFSELRVGGYFKLHGLIQSQLYMYLGIEDGLHCYRKYGEIKIMRTSKDKIVFTDNKQLA